MDGLPAGSDWWCLWVERSTYSYKLSTDLFGVQSAVIPKNKDYWGDDDTGVPLVTWIHTATHENQVVLNLMKKVSVEWLPYIVHEKTSVVVSSGSHEARLSWSTFYV
ncbi:MAG: hypothetical protein IPM37_23280 [Hahellaceae bacterium]|nr:hypothetical protein [Hahellaceae bacterium]